MLVPKLFTMKWTTKSGDQIQTYDMTPAHAEKTVLMLMRSRTPNIVLELILKGAQGYRQAAQEREVVPNGDMAQEFNDSQEMDYFESYEDEMLSTWNKPNHEDIQSNTDNSGCPCGKYINKECIDNGCGKCLTHTHAEWEHANS